MTTRTRRSSAIRGKTNDGPHKTLRKRLLADLKQRPGQPCARCGLPMYVAQLLDLDHTDDRTGYLGLSHRACNRRDGQRKTTAILKARRWILAPRRPAQTEVLTLPLAMPEQPPLRSSREW